MNPVCSATPTPKSATRTTPSGANPVNTFTMFARKVARLVPDSWFCTTSVRAPSLAGIVNSWPASSHDAIHTTTRAITKSAAGSGKRLPTRSTQWSAFSTAVWRDWLEVWEVDMTRSEHQYIGSDRQCEQIAENQDSNLAGLNATGRCIRVASA